MKSLSVSIGSLFAAISLSGCFPSFVEKTQLPHTRAVEGSFRFVDNAYSSLNGKDEEKIKSSEFEKTRKNPIDSVSDCAYIRNSIAKRGRYYL